MVHAPIVQQAPAVDPLATVNARLDKMERQISDIQSVRFFRFNWMREIDLHLHVPRLISLTLGYTILVLGIEQVFCA